MRGQIVQALVGGRIAPQVRYGLAEFFDNDGEAIGFVVAFHVNEGIAMMYQLVLGGSCQVCLLGDVAEVGDFRLQAPVPIVLLEELVLVEESDVLILASSVQGNYPWGTHPE